MNFSEFSEKDLELIRDSYESLKTIAFARCRNESECATVQKAFEFANQAHKNVRRGNGDPYIIHPIEVARIVVSEIGLGYKSISAALLHDVVEDSGYTVDDVRTLFGDKIASLVDGLNKIKAILDNEDRSKASSFANQSIRAENFKRILLTLGDDVRVVLVKLADRLQNCRTLDNLPEYKRSKILSETMYIFIPLSHRLGLYGIKTEMENIWLKYTEPQAYSQISERIQGDYETKEREIDEFISPIKDALDAKGFSYTVKKRVKSPYSIWHKMTDKHVSFDQIYDLYAVRIIYDPLADDPDTEKDNAFMIYRIVTQLYNQLPGRLRNWIQIPKSNGYSALHCTLMSRFGFWVEVQIRSRRMDDIAEKGIAAHWTYKKNGYSGENDSEVDRWLVKVQEILQTKELDDMDLLEMIQDDLVAKEIVVFTPKGEQKNIPSGSTALDFAYAIHSHIGDKAIAAKVNMKLVPLSQVLKSGDQIEIITAGSGKPKVEWLKFLHTRNAKSKVIDHFRSDYDRIASEGKKIFNERFSATGLPLSNDNVKRFLDFFNIRDLSEMYFRTGLGIIGHEEFRTAMDGIMPGGLSMQKQGEGKVRFSIRGIDRTGVLNDISACITLTSGVTLSKIHLGSDDGLFDGYMEITAEDRTVLDSLVVRLNKIDGVQTIVRTDI